MTRVAGWLVGLLAVGLAFAGGVSCSQMERAHRAGTVAVRGDSDSPTDGALPVESVKSSTSPEVAAAQEEDRQRTRYRYKVSSTSSDIEVRGELDKGALKRAIIAAQSRFDRCYMDAVMAGGDLKGRVVFRWVVRPDGSAEEVAVEESSIENQSLLECFQGVLAILEYPRPTRGSAEVRYPFLFMTVPVPAEESSRNVSSVGGKLDKAAVQRVINGATHKIQGCYEKRLLEKPGLAGRLVFDWTILPDGSVENVRLRSSTMGIGGEEVAVCIVSVLGEQKFPEHQGGPVEIGYPFLFRSIQ